MEYDNFPREYLHNKDFTNTMQTVESCTKGIYFPKLNNFAVDQKRYSKSFLVPFRRKTSLRLNMKRDKILFLLCSI